MPLGNFGQIPSADASTKELADYVARLIKEVNYLLNGGLDTLNVNELSADVINAGTLNAALVTVKAALTGAAFILINAAQGMVINDGTKNTFQADINGLVTMVGALIQSAAAYPRVEMNSTNSLFGAYQSANQYVRMDPAASGATPGFTFQNGAGITALLYLLTTDLFMATPAGSANIQISSGSDLFLNSNGSVKLNPSGSLQINGTSGYTGFVDVVTSVTFGPTGGGTYTTKRITFTKGIVTGVS